MNELIGDTSEEKKGGMGRMEVVRLLACGLKYHRKPIKLPLPCHEEPLETLLHQFQSHGSRELQKKQEV